MPEICLHLKRHLVSKPFFFVIIKKNFGLGPVALNLEDFLIFPSAHVSPSIHLLFVLILKTSLDKLSISIVSTFSHKLIYYGYMSLAVQSFWSPNVFSDPFTSKT
jgi:hypothetical protein